MAKIYVYFVEGKTEEKVVNVLKTDFQYILPGKVQVFDIVKEKITINKLRPLTRGTIVVLVFDTDTDNRKLLDWNISFLREHNFKVVCIPQVENLEDELKRSCNISDVQDITKSKSNKDFKRDLIRLGNLKSRLINCSFYMEKFWASMPRGTFAGEKNDSDKIRT